MNQDIRIRPCGDQALMVMFVQRISEEIHGQVMRLDSLLREDPTVLETVPASNVTYTAQWQINQYTVTFAANGGTGGWSRKQNF